MLLATATCWPALAMQAMLLVLCPAVGYMLPVLLDSGVNVTGKTPSPPLHLIGTWADESTQIPKDLVWYNVTMIRLSKHLES